MGHNLQDKIFLSAFGGESTVSATTNACYCESVVLIPHRIRVHLSAVLSAEALA